jgi:hypothetical protein
MVLHHQYHLQYAQQFSLQNNNPQKNANERIGKIISMSTHAGMYSQTLQASHGGQHDIHKSFVLISYVPVRSKIVREHL